MTRYPQSFTLDADGETEPFFHDGGPLAFLPSGDLGGGSLEVQYVVGTADEEPDAAAWTNPGRLGDALTEATGQRIDAGNVWLRVSLSGATAPDVSLTFTRV